MKTFGVVYLVFLNKKGPSTQAFKEYEYSASSLRKTNPNIPITLITDIDYSNTKLYDTLIKIPPSNQIRQKMYHLEKSPYDYSLYVDADTSFVNDISDMFKILDRFDVALVADGTRKVDTYCKLWDKYNNVPEAFGEFCGGVMLYKKCKKITDFFEIWRTNYEWWKSNTEYITDQQSLRVSLWESDLYIHTLPVEYNIRTINKVKGMNEKYPKTPKIYHWHRMYKKLPGRIPHHIFI